MSSGLQSPVTIESMLSFLRARQAELSTPKNSHEYSILENLKLDIAALERFAASREPTSSHH